ncbi:TetR family transcriptional regulator [Metabacillus sp. GX 13764]|uniref:TetR family transcriptional regulator n=1 Tax=Metabacillus kandeliae TaxID=2900151 RepID=UPI001E5D04EB|nr:TetR family transcriptional regulator [Metabacillus kandeliae]MCD7035345.1 TetR family transcriptional regulator [Metabacillus kandeliae]
MDMIETVLYSIPQSETNSELIDCDWNDNYGLLAVIEKNKKLIIQIGDRQLSLDIHCDYPLIRWIDSTHFLIADTRNDGTRKNLHILNTNGEIQNSFNGGDGIQDIVASEEGIWISYFDEGVFGSGISTEGLVLFSYDGTPEFKYHSELIDGPPIAECYAIGKAGSSLLWLFPYTDFPLICVNPVEKTLISYEVPEVLHGSNAICVRGFYAYFYEPYHSEGELYCWKIGKSKPEIIGEIPGRVRGLATREANHFISMHEHQIRVYRIVNQGETEY